MTSPAAWQRAHGALWRYTPRSLVALAPGRGEPVRIVGLPAELWAALVVPRSLADLETVAAARAHEGSGRDEVHSALEALAHAGLVEPAP